MTTRHSHPPSSTPGTSGLSLDLLNEAGGHETALALLAGLYEHSDWIIEKALAARPFQTLAHFRQVCRDVVTTAPLDAQVALIRAHPELTGKAKIDPGLARDSKSEQQAVGLDRCSPEEFEALTQLNARYKETFGWPFILAVRGPRGSGLTRGQIITTIERRLKDPPDQERKECLHQIHRIAEMRLNERFGIAPVRGERIWDDCQTLSSFSEDTQGLTVSYLTKSHQEVAHWLIQSFKDAGFQQVHQDAVGNVVGRWGDPPYLLTGSHFDTVRNGGRYDGRLGILVPLEFVRQKNNGGGLTGPGIELVAFAEEEGVRYAATFLGSSALIGGFQHEWLDACDAKGVPMRQAMQTAGLAADINAIKDLKRDPSNYLGFVEVHIEQGPVLASQGLPLGVVTAINGSLRYRIRLTGQAAHAGTTPMGQRRDAAVAAAEFMLYAEERAGQDPGLVATVGQLQVPNGSTNVIAGVCEFSLDLRAPTNEERDALGQDVLDMLAAIAKRRGIETQIEQVLQASAAPSDPLLQGLWEKAVADCGLPVFHLPSGAGHDAMKLHEAMPQAMLFVRGENQGISHNPLESTTSEDIELAVEAFEAFYRNLAKHLVKTKAHA